MITGPEIQQFNNVLILEDDVIFCEETIDRLQAGLYELRQKNWDVFYLGAYAWGHPYAMSSGCHSLREVGVGTHPEIGPTCTHAIAYHRHCFEHLLHILPATADSMLSYQPENQRAVDQILAHDSHLKRFISEPHIASQPPLLKHEQKEFKTLLPEQTEGNESTG